MAFQIKNLSVIAYANGFTLWHYTSNDTMEDILSAKYFADSCVMFNDNDIMLINAKDKSGFRCVACATNKETVWESLK